MSQPHIHACPSCGAPLAKGDQVQCSYCGNYVTMDDRARVPLVSPPPILRVSLPAAPHTSRPPASFPAFEPILGALGGYAFFVVFVPTAICLVLCACLSVIEPLTKVGGRSAAQPTPTRTRIVVPPTPKVLPTPALVFGGAGTGPGQFQDARHIAIDGNDNIFVSDYGSLRVQRFDGDGKYLGGWSIEAKGKLMTKSGAEALAADGAGNVYVVWTGLILKYEGATGRVLDTFAGEKIDDATGLTEDYKSVAVGQDGELWAVSDVNSRDDLVHLDADGKVIGRVKNIISGDAAKSSSSSTAISVGTFVSPANLLVATDASGSIYMVHRSVYDPAVFKFTPDGQFLNRFGSYGNRPGEFSMASPPAVATDGRGRIYVADDYGIQMFGEDGRYINAINTDRKYLDAIGIAVNSKSEIYVVNGDNMVFKFPPFPD